MQDPGHAGSDDLSGTYNSCLNHTVSAMYMLCIPLYNECTLKNLANEERSFLQAVSKLAYCNPFLPERTELERAALGRDFVEGEPVWSQTVDNPDQPRANVWKIFDRLEPLMTRSRER